MVETAPYNLESRENTLTAWKSGANETDRLQFRQNVMRSPLHENKQYIINNIIFRVTDLYDYKGARCEKENWPLYRAPQMPTLEPELAHLTIAQRPPQRQPGLRRFDLHYRDTKGRLQRWSPAWPILPWEAFDPAYDLYLVLDQGDPVVVRAALENGRVVCTQINADDAQPSTMSREEFDHICLAIVQTSTWRPGAPDAQT